MTLAHDRLLLNCDLGESYGERTVGDDAGVMPHLDQANIACGFHGGDPLTMRRTLELAARHGVAVGAHPSYPDLEGFGRRSMALPAAELVAALHYQIAAIDGMAAAIGTTLSHVKPHGALYNDMMASPGVRATVIEALASYHRPLPLMLLASADWREHSAEAAAAGISPIFECFADRRYLADGSLMPRDREGAVLCQEDILAQVRLLRSDRSVITADGGSLELHAQSLCLHGDNPASVAVAPAVAALLRNA